MSDSLASTTAVFVAVCKSDYPEDSSNARASFATARGNVNWIFYSEGFYCEHCGDNSKSGAVIISLIQVGVRVLRQFTVMTILS